MEDQLLHENIPINDKQIKIHRTYLLYFISGRFIYYTPKHI